jgi:hypothetical protein
MVPYFTSSPRFDSTRRLLYKHADEAPQKMIYERIGLVLIVGGIAGLLAVLVMKGRGYSAIADIILILESWARSLVAGTRDAGS